MPGIAEARKVLADCVRRHVDELAEEAIAEHRARGGQGYAVLTDEALRAITLTGYGAIITDIEADPPHHFGDMFVRAMKGRIQQGFRAHDMRFVMAIANRSLNRLCHREYPDLAQRIAAIERCHAVLEATQDLMFAAFAAFQEDFLRAQFDIVDRLSAPIIPIYPGILLVPLIGPIDARRAEQIMEALLTAVGRERGEAVLLDITGVPEIDPGVADLLAKASQAARLLGASVAIVGIRPAIAQTMVAGQVDLGGAITLANLQAGLEYALSQRGLVIQPGGTKAAATRGGGLAQNRGFQGTIAGRRGPTGQGR
jgi:rsbT co-antagonist protein RsbR